MKKFLRSEKFLCEIFFEIQEKLPPTKPETPCTLVSVLLLLCVLFDRDNCPSTGPSKKFLLFFVHSKKIYEVPKISQRKFFRIKRKTPPAKPETPGTLVMALLSKTILFDRIICSLKHTFGPAKSKKVFILCE